MLRNKTALVNFRSTSCPPCREEIPDLGQLYERFREKGVIILAISSDKAADLREYTAAQKIISSCLLIMMTR